MASASSTASRYGEGTHASEQTCKSSPEAPDCYLESRHQGRLLLLHLTEVAIQLQETEGPVDRPFWKKQEFLSMFHKEISIPRLAQVRDIFCFCCLTGLAFTDVQQLKAEHLVADIHGKIWIRKARQKTKNMCNIPLLDEAQKIIDRYRDHPYCQTHGVLLPVCSNQKMNSYLKELADICGIRKNLSTHCARHTFATLTLASGATIDNVAKMLGHANVNMTRRYAKVLDSSIMRDMEVVAENMAL